ncbi:MAG: hypothetical protein PVI30_16950 [Myxococcales bacterium]
MSIVALQRVTLVGRARDRDAILEAVQSLGRMHVVYGDRERRGREPAALEEGRSVLHELATAPHQRRPLARWGARDAVSVASRTLALREERLNLADERDRVLGQIRLLEPWGDFRVPSRDELGGLGLWFYAVPLQQLAEFEGLDYPRREVARDNVTAYLVLVAAEQPEGTPVGPLELADRSLSELRGRVEEIEERLDEIAAERADLARFRDLLEEHYLRTADDATLKAVREAAGGLGGEPLFVLHGYWPRRELDALRGLRRRWPLAVVSQAVPEGEEPPTLLHNRGLAESGQSLVSFYATPAADAWDPSAWVMTSFALFFAMILSDAGYAALLLSGTALAWRRLGGSRRGRIARRMLVTLGGAAALWGVAVGSYFGVAPPPGSSLARLARLDVADADQMMALSVWIGAIHLGLANLRLSLQLRGESRALAPLGWCFLLAAGVAGWQGMREPAMALGALGVLLVLVFSAPGQGAGGRVLGGLKGLAGVTGAFGDVLSYLRLFALGLASASLAGAFNDLAADARSGAMGLLSATLILLVGHGLNLALAVMGGFVHGLRLNFIEFFKWGLEGEGRPFVPFRKLSSDPEEP